MGGQGRVVDAHVELEELVLGFAGDTLAGEVDAMPHVKEVIDALDLEDVGLVVGKIVVGFDAAGNVLEVIAGLQLDVYHAAVDARARRDGHGEGGFDAFDGFDGNGVPHAHAGTEIGIGQSLGSTCLQDGANHGIGAGIPTGGHDGDGVVAASHFVQRAAEGDGLGVDVEAVDSVDAHGEGFGGILLDAAGGGAEDGNLHARQFPEAAHHRVLGNFRGNLGGVAAHNACDFKVRRNLQGFDYIFSDVAVSDNGYFDFFHSAVLYLLFCETQISE